LPFPILSILIPTLLSIVINFPVSGLSGLHFDHDLGEVTVPGIVRDHDPDSFPNPDVDPDKYRIQFWQFARS
jgi:hypothetical protein